MKAECKYKDGNNTDGNFDVNREGNDCACIISSDRSSYSGDVLLYLYNFLRF